MKILCDTCAILMLLRINPEMFTNPIFECETINEVRTEFNEKQKFKIKYPWKSTYLKFIKTHTRYDESIKFIIEGINQSKLNPSTNEPYDLSYVDRCLMAALYDLDDVIFCSGDSNAMDFAFNELEHDCISPLELINKWLKDCLIVWDIDKQLIIVDWISQNERRQPPRAIGKFTELTGFDYPK